MIAGFAECLNQLCHDLHDDAGIRASQSQPALASPLAKDMERNGRAPTGPEMNALAFNVSDSGSELDHNVRNVPEKWSSTWVAVRALFKEKRK